MRMPANLKTLALPLFVWLAFFAVDAHAAIDNAGVFDSVLDRYQAAASGWAGVITTAATWLFWTLVVISMVWTFGMMALRKADIGEFFAEFVRFTIFTGFFWWALTNGPNFASSIYASLRQLAGNATGLGNALSPSGIVDVGFAIFDKVMDQSSVWSPVDSMAGILMAVAILVILALVGVNMLLLLASGWVLAYGGVFFLGFGGSRWTSDMAINYYKVVLGVAAQLFAMVLLVGIGKTFLDDYYSRMSAGISLKEMGVMLIVVIILLALVNKIPPLIAGIITGASVGGAGIGQFGAGAALGAAGMAAAAAATGGAALGPDTFKFFQAMGVPLRTLYGQTEMLGAYTLHPLGKVDPDTTGVAMAADIEVRVDNPDVNGVGEIVVRHPNMYLGYYKNPEASAADMKDGWMHSGDAGYFNADRQLVVIDRIKDLAETSRGERFSPQYLENKLKFSPYIAETVVLGAGRDTLAAMICIRFSIISKWAEKKRISFTTYTDLSSRPEVYELLRKEVESVNTTLPPAQRISRFLLLYKELDADDGELTRTRKVRRSVINEKYADIIDAIYGGKRDIPVDTVIRFQDGTTQRIRTTLRVVDLGLDAPMAEAAE